MTYEFTVQIDEQTALKALSWFNWLRWPRLGLVYFALLAFTLYRFFRGDNINGLLAVALIGLAVVAVASLRERWIWKAKREGGRVPSYDYTVNDDGFAVRSSSVDHSRQWSAVRHVLIDHELCLIAARGAFAIPLDQVQPDAIAFIIEKSTQTGAKLRDRR